MDIKKVLQDYISYHWIEEFITDEQKDAMLKNLGVYVKGMIPQLTIHSVVVTLPPYKECDCVDPLKCYRICHDLIGRSGNAL